MAFQDKKLLAFNRGVISKIGLARIDMDRMAMSAELQTNFMPRVLGSMMLRPGLEYIDNVFSDASFHRNMPFTFGVDDNVLIEMGPASIRFRVNDQLITKPVVTAVIGNPLFTAPVPDAFWIDTSDSGGTMGHFGGKLLLKGDGTDFGRTQQTVVVVEPGTEHFVNINVDVGPVRFKIGSATGLDDYVTETRLGQGQNYLAFTPAAGNFVIEIANEREFDAEIDLCQMSGDGNALLLTSPYSAADLPLIRWAQSGDVIYIAGGAFGENTYKLERRGTGRSWSFVLYLPEDGPFRIQNVSGVTITPSAINGNITLTASEPLFKNSHVTGRSLWKIDSVGQVVTKAISSEDDFTDPIRVTGTGEARRFSVFVEGTFSATVTLQFAFDIGGPWNDQGSEWTTPISTTILDQQDGLIIFYRIGIKAGDYTSGTATCTLSFQGGSITGIARANGFQSETILDAIVLKDFGAITASRDWSEGEWSDFRGFPSAVDLFEARLFFAGNDKIWGSVVDAFESFDSEVVGDAGAISRSVGFGPIRVIHWLKSLGRLMFGTSENSAQVDAAKMDGNSVLGARSNSFDEPLTPTNFNIKTASSRAVFVDRTEQRLYELLYDLDQQDYRSMDLSVFAPDFNEVGITQIAVQMKPDIRVHCVRSDGTVGVLVYARLENVIAWIEVNSPGAGGEIEDVAVLPGTVEDQVYYIVKRTINGGTERHIQKWAQESECQGGQLSRCADDFAVYTGPPTSIPFQGPLSHLVGETVVVWSDGADIGTYVVDPPGHLDISPLTTSNCVAGLAYTAQFKSAKLGELQGIGLLERKKVARLGFIAKWLHYQGLKYGPTLPAQYDLPLVEDGQTTPADTVWEDYHEDDFSFGGDWDTDSRICLQAAAPRPCTVLAALAIMESIEKGRNRR